MEAAITCLSADKTAMELGSIPDIATGNILCHLPLVKLGITTSVNYLAHIPVPFLNVASS